MSLHILIAVIPIFLASGSAMQSRIAAAKADIANLEVALDAFEIDVGRYPSTEEGLGSLIEAPKDLKNWTGPYIKRLPKDPWGKPYLYVCPGKHNPNGFDLSSAGPDGVAGNEDDIRNNR